MDGTGRGPTGQPGGLQEDLEQFYRIEQIRAPIKSKTRAFDTSGSNTYRPVPVKYLPNAHHHTQWKSIVNENKRV